MFEGCVVMIESLLQIDDNCIMPDSEFANELGFVSELFEGYLFKDGDYIYISFIVSKEEAKGNLRRLFKNILDNGYGIKVPCPFPKMEFIVNKLGFKQTFEFENMTGEDVSVWIKEKGANL